MKVKIQKVSFRFILGLEDTKRGKPVEATFCMPRSNGSKAEIFRLRPLVRFSKAEIAILEEWIVDSTKELEEWSDISAGPLDRELHLIFYSVPYCGKCYLIFNRKTGVISVALYPFNEVSESQKLELWKAISEILVE